MNYATLSQAIMDWLSKDNIQAVLPILIRFGQRHLEDSLRIRPMEVIPVNAAISAGTGSLDIPADFLELKYLTLLDGTNRYPITIAIDAKEFQHISPDTADTGLPTKICQIGDKLYFNLKTDILYTREWCYYQRITTLVASAPNNTNWWSEQAEEAFLMSCLHKASRYITGITPEDKKKWEIAAAEAIEEVRQRFDMERTGGTVHRTYPWRT